MKTTVNTNQTHNKKPSKASALVTLATTAALAGSMFFASPSFGQQQKKPVGQKPTSSKQVNTGKNSATTKFLTQEQIDSVNMIQNKQKTMEEINKFRAANNIAPVVYDSKLDTIAQEYADYCAANNRDQGHTDKRGRTFFDRMRIHECRWDATENLCFWFDLTPERVVDARSRSDSWHRDAMLRLFGKRIWIGIARFADGSCVYVMIIINK